MPLTCLLVPESERTPGLAEDSYFFVPAVGLTPLCQQVGQCRSPRGQVQQEAGRTLEEARPGDSGIYTCWATNLQATGTATTRVYMTRGPHVSPAPS